MYTLTQVILIAIATVVLVLIAIVKLTPDTDGVAAMKKADASLRESARLLKQSAGLILQYKSECDSLRERVRFLETILKMKNDHGL